MRQRQVLFAVVVLVTLSALPLAAQKYYSDDPLWLDRDDLPIPLPAYFDISPTMDGVENSFGSEAEGPRVRAQNINTLGEVPDSSWFTNRIGLKPQTAQSLVGGDDRIGPPDLSRPLKVLGGGLAVITPGLIVEDARGVEYYLKADPERYPRLATGADIIANKLLHAAGYHVPPTNIVHIDPADLELAPDATILLLGGKHEPMDQEFLDLWVRDSAREPDGRVRVSANRLPDGEGVGKWKFYGTRSDDANDIFAHENRRELRGLQLFAAWLNHYFCNAMLSYDFYIGEPGQGHLRHYLLDHSTSLGSGLDIEAQELGPKRPSSGNEPVTSDFGDSLKTALSLGLWERPWMKIEYPYPKYAEIGRFESEQFEPRQWTPDYPNAAFQRMLPDDALWAADILERFDDQLVAAAVSTAEYQDPEAAAYLTRVLGERRDKLLREHTQRINPLVRFRIAGNTLVFENLGELAGLGGDSSYVYQWFVFDNDTLAIEELSGELQTRERSIPLPRETHLYLMLRLRTLDDKQPGWKKAIEVFIRNQPQPELVGIERETGLTVLSRPPGEGLAETEIEFGGAFENLPADQRGLIEDWFERFEQATGVSVPPDEGYDSLPLSVRTTYSAVSHALASSELTSSTGRSLGRPLDLVASLETVNGKIPGAGGDVQFRIYVRLVDDAVERLEESQEFKRGHENTVYHKGYPQNFRQGGSVPTMQISVSEDGRRADIDVDYRSSKIPQALLNGHLSSANSDVRAGNNHELHVNRWAGLDEWWTGIFGVPWLEKLLQPEELEETVGIPELPLQKHKQVGDAVQDFLNLWLTRGRPAEAAAYMTRGALECLRLETGESRDNFDYGMAPFRMLRGLIEVSELLGESQDLSDAVVGVRAADPRLRLVEHAHGPAFTLYDVPEAYARARECAVADDPLTQAQAKGDKYGKYYAAFFELRVPGRQAETIGTLWKKESGYWRLVSYELEPFADRTAIPQLVAAPEVTLQQVDGDPGFIEANQSFLQAWFIAKDVDVALGYLAASASDCNELFRPEELPPATSRSESRQRIHDNMRLIAEHPGPVSSLDQALLAVEATHPDLRLVRHSQPDAYTLVEVPEQIALELDCQRRLRDAPLPTAPTNPRYRGHYGTIFELALAGGEPAALALLWEQTDGEWKVVAYDLMTP